MVETFPAKVARGDATSAHEMLKHCSWFPHWSKAKIGIFHLTYRPLPFDQSSIPWCDMRACYMLHATIMAREAISRLLCVCVCFPVLEVSQCWNLRHQEFKYLVLTFNHYVEQRYRQISKCQSCKAL